MRGKENNMKKYVIFYTNNKISFDPSMYKYELFNVYESRAKDKVNSHFFSRCLFYIKIGINLRSFNFYFFFYLELDPFHYTHVNTYRRAHFILKLSPFFFFLLFHTLIWGRCDVIYSATTILLIQHKKNPKQHIYTHSQFTPISRWKKNPNENERGKKEAEYY